MTEASTTSLAPVDAQLLQVWVPAADRHPARIYLARLAPSGRRSQRSALERIGRWMSGEVLGWEKFPWHLVRYPHAAALRTHLAESYGSPATANTYRAALRGVMRECWRLGYISAEEHDLIRDVERVRGERLLRGRALSRGELVATFGALDVDDSVSARRDAALIAVAYASGGVRRKELVELDLEDLDLELAHLRVIGKGNKERKVFLSEEAMSAVRDWLDVRGTEPGPLFLPIEKDRRTPAARRLSASTAWLACQRRAEQAQVAAFSPHDLRRSSISDLIDQTGDLSLVSTLAGHASPATTAGYDRRPEETRSRAARGLHLPYRSRHLGPRRGVAGEGFMSGKGLARELPVDHPSES